MKRHQRCARMAAALLLGVALLTSPLHAEDEFLAPEQAYQYAARIEGNRLIIQWRVEPGYYLYKKKLGLTTAASTVRLGAPAWPKGENHHDEYFGDQEIYRGSFEVPVTIETTGARPEKIPIELKLQGCADAGLCYPPLTWRTDVAFAATAAAAERDPRLLFSKKPASANAFLSRESPATARPAPPLATPLAKQDQLAALIRDGNLAAVLGTFFALGLLLAFTPCVLPMIPILSGIIVGQVVDGGDKVTAVRGFSLAFTYVQGMALTYAAAGAAFVLAFKQAPQAFFQQPWIVILFALLFVALAIAMFGAYNIQLPSSLQTRLTSVSNEQKSGTFVGTFVMGALSALIVTACVAPAIIAALSVISQTGQIARGAAALYATGLGMGVPLLIVGASAGSLLPRVGPWMDTVKQVFGVLFLGVALYLLQPLLPAAVTLLSWSALAVIFGFWIFSLKARDGGYAPAVIRATGLLILIYGVILLLGLASGGRDPLQPLDRLVGGSVGGAPQGREVAFERIKSVADLDRKLSAARDAGKPVMLDFYADWCVSCKEMEKYTFADAAVRKALANALLLQADVTANDAQDQALLARFQIFGPPTIAFFNARGVESRNFRVVGYMKAKEFAPHVQLAFAGS